MMGGLLHDDHELVDVFFFEEPTHALVDCLKREERFKVFEGTKDNSIIAVRSHSKIAKNAQSFDDIKKTSKISPENINKI